MTDLDRATIVDLNLDALAALDGLARAAGLDPGAISLPRDVVENLTAPTTDDHGDLARYLLRRCAAWATVLESALPTDN